jgi:arylsulfatase A-like enzyme
VVSDHGYSTVTEAVEIEALLRDNGFPPGATPGGVVVATNGGSVLFYAHDRDRAVGGRLAEWLMARPWCGPIVASDAMGDIPGTLPASLVGAEGERAPDLAMSFAWDSRPNDAGFDGHIYSTDKSPGQGQHGSMSKHELRCTLIARGPSFNQHATVATPTGNVDVTPTILRLLGISTDVHFDGRVLDEALAAGADPSAVDWSTETHRAERDLAAGVYRQQITVSRVGATSYVDEGKASLEAP